MLGDSTQRLSPRRSLGAAGEVADDGCLEVETALGGRLVADQVLPPYGWTSNIEGLGLDRAGVKTDMRGSIVVDGGITELRIIALVENG
jgi:pyruvate/2-oxoglutarate dehydrogenase complex dihydrolipoamide dehydrogenase (E3) component